MILRGQGPKEKTIYASSFGYEIYTIKFLMNLSTFNDLIMEGFRFVRNNWIHTPLGIKIIDRILYIECCARFPNTADCEYILLPFT